MAVYKRGEVWWFKFSWKGGLIRESTKQGNKRVAEQIESGRKTQLAEVIAGFVAKRRHADMEVSTINRDIATACSTWRKSGNESRPSCRRCGCCPERINASACSPQTRNCGTWTRR
jgi:hypothetical protein